MHAYTDELRGGLAFSKKEFYKPHVFCFRILGHKNPELTIYTAPSTFPAGP